MTGRLVMTPPDIAEALGLEPADFLRRLPYLRRVGFPRHLPGLGMRWARSQVESWIAAGGLRAVEAPAPSGLRLIVDNANATLRARYAGGRT